MNWKFDFSPVTSAIEGQPSPLGYSAFMKVYSVYVHMLYAAVVDWNHWNSGLTSLVEVDTTFVGLP